MTGIIAVGVDGSEGGQRALHWAVEEARLRGARLRMVHVWSYLNQPESAFDPKFGEHDARRVIDAVVADGSDRLEGLEIEEVVVNDLPARGLLEAAREADLLVVGSRGVGGFKGLLLGSVSQQVVQHAKCPVVIVPGQERAGLAP